MREREIVDSILNRRTAEHCFVKWWRKENDFVDYDMIDRFIDNINKAEEIDGLDLLTMDEMWETVTRICDGRVKLVRESKGDRVEWTHTGKSGTHHKVCIYTPETVMTIFDVETKGNPIGT